MWYRSGDKLSPAPYSVLFARCYLKLLPCLGCRHEWCHTIWASTGERWQATFHGTQVIKSPSSKMLYLREWEWAWILTASPLTKGSTPAAAVNQLNMLPAANEPRGKRPSHVRKTLTVNVHLMCHCGHPNSMRLKLPKCKWWCHVLRFPCSVFTWLQLIF